MRSVCHVETVRFSDAASEEEEEDNWFFKIASRQIIKYESSN